MIISLQQDQDHRSLKITGQRLSCEWCAFAALMEQQQFGVYTVYTVTIKYLTIHSEQNRQVVLENISCM